MSVKKDVEKMEEQIRDEAGKVLSSAKDSLEGKKAELESKAKELQKDVKKSPWKWIGIAAGAAALLMLIVVAMCLGPTLF